MTRKEEVMQALWRRIGPHAVKGTKLAKDNKIIFETNYHNAAKQIANVKGKGPMKQEVDALSFSPTPYGWPQSRSFDKGTKYTGVVPIFQDGEYKVTIDVWPETAKARIVLEIDGKRIEQVATPNKTVRVSLQAGVRALTILTENEVRMRFRKLNTTAC